jgi:dienelactone hydrolase
MKIVFLLAALLAVSATGAPVNQPTPADDLVPVSADAFHAIVQFYQYDASIPLEARVVEHVDAGAMLREKIVFSDHVGDRVPALLSLPKNSGARVPCVVLLHGIGGSKEDWWRDDSREKEIVVRLAAAGVATFAIDAAYHGERADEGGFEPAQNFWFEHHWSNRMRELIVHSTIDARRALDYLATRRDIDSAQIGALGYSLGGMMTCALAAIDSRVKVAVVCVAPPLSRETFKFTGTPYEDRDLYAAVAPYNFARVLGNRPMLFLYATQDVYCTVEDAKRFYALIPGEAKRIKFYEAPHYPLPPEYLSDSVAFLLRTLRPAAEAR